MMDEIIFMIEELNQQQSIFMNKIRYTAKLLQEYYQMAKPAVEAAGLSADFSRMENQIVILEKMQKVLEREHELEALFEIQEDAAQQDGRKEVHVAIDRLCEKVAKLEAGDCELEQLVNDVQQFDETLRFDETYEDIMGYVGKLRKHFADYHMVSGMVRNKLLELYKAYQNNE